MTEFQKKGFTSWLRCDPFTFLEGNWSWYCADEGF